MLNVFTEKCNNECIFQNTSTQSHQKYAVREDGKKSMSRVMSTLLP